MKSVSVIDAVKDVVVETIDCKPVARLPFGTGSNAVALSPDGATLYVANGSFGSMWANHPYQLLGLLSQSRERARSLNSMLTVTRE